jgi:hypothetical protein
MNDDIKIVLNTPEISVEEYLGQLAKEGKQQSIGDYIVFILIRIDALEQNFLSIATAVGTKIRSKDD